MVTVMFRFFAAAVDVVDPGTEGCDKLEVVSRLRQYLAVDSVCNRRHEDVGFGDGGGELRLRHRRVLKVEASIE